MVNLNSPALDRTFQALADPTRRAMLFRIAQKEHTISELAAPFEMSLAAVSKHLKVLERASFITKVKKGRETRCRINPEPFHDAADLIRSLEAFWTRQLDSLARYFESEAFKQGGRHEHKRKNRIDTETSRPEDRKRNKRAGL